MKQLKTTKDIPEGSVIRVYKKGFGYSRFRIMENREFYISGVCANTELYDNLSDLDTLEAYYWVHNFASFEFKLILTGRLVKDPFLLFFEHTDSINFSTDRKCIRAKVNIPLKYFVFDPKNKESGVSTENVVYHNSAVIELSDREAVIICDDPLPAGSHIFGHLALNDTTIEIIGQNLDETNKDSKRIQITFKGMHDKDRERILDYVFSVYRE